MFLQPYYLPTVQIAAAAILGACTSRCSWRLQRTTMRESTCRTTNGLACAFGDCKMVRRDIYRYAGTHRWQRSSRQPCRHHCMHSRWRRHSCNRGSSYWNGTLWPACACRPSCRSPSGPPRVLLKRARIQLAAVRIPFCGSDASLQGCRLSSSLQLARHTLRSDQAQTSGRSVLPICPCSRRSVRCRGPGISGAARASQKTSIHQSIFGASSCALRAAWQTSSSVRNSTAASLPGFFTLYIC